MIYLLLMVIILATFIPVAGAYSLFGFYKDVRHWRRYFVFGVLVVFTIAYNYIPVGHPDLVRYLADISKAEHYSLIRYVELLGDGLIVKNVVFWFAGKLGIPHLVPALSATIVYGVTVYISYDYAERRGLLKNAFWVLIIQCMMLPFVGIVNNVRNVCAFALICLAIYRETVQKRINFVTIALYILPCFMHKTGFFIIVVRLLSALMGRYMVVAIIASISMPIIVEFLYKYYRFFERFGLIGSFISRSILTAYRSMVSTSTWANTVMSSRYHLTNRYIDLAVCVLMIIISLLLSKKKQLVYSRYMYFCQLMCVITLGTNVFRTPVYWRFFSAVIIAGGPIICLAISNLQKNRHRENLWYMFIPLSAVLILFLNLYGYKENISYADLIINSLINPASVIAFTMLRNVFVI